MSMGVQAAQKRRAITYNQDLPGAQSDINAQEGAYGSRGAADYGGAAAGYSALANSGGYSDAEKAAMVTQGQDTTRAGYAGLRDSAERRSSRTGNTAGYYGAVGASDAAESNALGTQARQNVIDFAKEKERRNEAGYAGEAGLYGQNVGAEQGYAGMRARLAALRTTDWQQGHINGGGGTELSSMSGGYGGGGGGG